MEQIEVSFCLNNRGMLYCSFHEKGAILVLGAEYREVIKKLSGSEEALKLDEFGTAVSEKNRV